MWTRLIGAAVFWQAGLGVEAVAAAIALSVVAGLVPLRSLLGMIPVTPDKTASGLVLAAFPLAVLQAGQVILLDGDVIAAQILFGADDVGTVAALALFQRLQFFACISLAALLLPALTVESARRRTSLAAATPIFTLSAAATLLVVGATNTIPGPIITALVGSAYLPAAGAIHIAAAATAAFTFSYLLATYLAAMGDRSGIWAIACACPVQGLAMLTGADSVGDLMTIKFLCQLGLAGWLVVRAARRSFPAINPAWPLVAPSL